MVGSSGQKAGRMTHERACHQGAGRAGGYQGGDVVAVAQHDDGFHHRAVALKSDDVGWLFIAANHFRRMDDLQPGTVIRLAGEFGPEKAFIPGQDQV